MSSPLQEKSYLLGVLTVKAGLSCDERAAVLVTKLIEAGASVGSTIEEAVGCGSREAFRSKLYAANESIRALKFWLRLLDDCDLLSAETAAEVAAAAEEVQRIVVGCLRTLRQAGQDLRVTEPEPLPDVRTSGSPS